MFVKEPKLGFVKTRLAEHTTDEFALILYQFFVHDLIYTLQGGSHDFKLCVFGDIEHVNKTFGKYDNFLQADGDLGDKMQSAFEEMFEKGYEKITLIGSDTPHLTNTIIDKSFNELEKRDAVLGKCADGGYYMVGFSKETFDKNIFKGIEWSTSKVLQQTLQKLHTKDVYLTKELNDIDIIEDLENFFDKFQNGYFENSYTIEFLKESKEQWKNLT